MKIQKKKIWKTGVLNIWLMACEKICYSKKPLFFADFHLRFDLVKKFEIFDVIRSQRLNDTDKNPNSSRLLHSFTTKKFKHTQ